MQNWFKSQEGLSSHRDCVKMFEITFTAITKSQSHKPAWW